MTYTKEILKALQNNIEKVIVGKSNAINLVLIALLGRGHVLIEDVPGVGKTTMVSSLAKSLDLSFKRIQFTPDVLPSDITGFSMYNIKTGEMDFHSGLIMSHIILADEINRTSPKTQSSLLEVMEEGQVTVDGKTYLLPKPFMVLATQNPVEYVGTFPLPEAQLDRFFLKVSIGYPNISEEISMLSRFQHKNPIVDLSPVAKAEDILELQKATSNIIVADEIKEYIAQIVYCTRNHEDIVLGVSPRGSIFLMRAAQGYALLQNRDYVIPDDVQKMVIPVLSHRLILKPESKLKDITPAHVLESIIDSIYIPVVKL
ncbi:MAG: Holliday junction ATP-dependent DNA helicase RuvB [Xylanivirga thermophila]|uniref:AAA family ATPase n=1 Tax=Xylanivirga thermophila TaxID=2496273 RepID=UPI0039F44ECD